MDVFLRLDVYLVKSGIIQSRSKAQRLIIDKKILVNNVVEVKPSRIVSNNDNIEIVDNGLKYVSRGGYKLEKALKEFNINLVDYICVDIGASTGGFTDVMLQNGAKKIYAIDVGHSQLDKKLLKDKRVINLEKTNIRELNLSTIKDTVDFISTDVSFISLKYVIPVINKILNSRCNKNQSAVILIKPQFEAGRKHLNKKGVVSSKKAHLEVLNNIQDIATENNFMIKNASFSPIKGGEGNIEYLFYLCRNNGIISYNMNDFKKIIDNAFIEAF